jgi:hypothetical protein
MLVRKHLMIGILGLGLIGFGCKKKSDSKDDSAVPENKLAPSAISIALPSTLTKKSEESSLRLEADEPGEGGPSNSASQGYFELTESINRIQDQLAGLTLDNAILDKVMEAQCDFEADAKCSVKGDKACATVDATMLAIVQNSLGPKAFEEDGDLAGMLEQEDQEICFASISIEKLKKSKNQPYDFEATIIEDKDNETNMSWSLPTEEKAGSVRVVNTYKESFDEFEMPEESVPEESIAINEELGPVFTGKATLTYDATNKVFAMNDVYSMKIGSEVDSNEESLKITGLSAAGDLGDNAVHVKAQIKSSFSGNESNLSLTAIAGEEGGFVRTNSSFSYYSVTAAQLSANCEVGQQYFFYPPDDANDDTDTIEDLNIFMLQSGSFYCDEASTTLTGSSVFLNGPPPANASTLRLFTVEFPAFEGESGEGSGDSGDEQDPPFPLKLAEEDFFPTVASSTLTFTSLTASRVSESYCYEEEFTPEGEITAWRSGTGNCDATGFEWENTEGKFSTSFDLDKVAKSENIKEPKLTITKNGESITAQDLQQWSNQSAILPTLLLVDTECGIRYTYIASRAMTDLASLIKGKLYPKDPSEAPKADLSQYVLQLDSEDLEPEDLALMVERYSDSRVDYECDENRSSGAVLTKK